MSFHIISNPWLVLNAFAVWLLILVVKHSSEALS